MRDRYLYLAFVLILVASIASAPAQHHPLSQLFPADADLNLGGKDVRNVSVIETAILEPNSSDITFRDNGNSNILVWDDSESQWKVSGGDLNLTENKLTGVGGTECSSNKVLLGDGSCGSTGGSQNLSEVLSNGNSTGSNGIDMNGNDIENPGNVPVYVINEDFDDGSADGWTVDNASCSTDSGITSNPSDQGDSPAIDPRPINTNALQVAGDDNHTSPTVDVSSYSSLTLKAYVSSNSMDDSSEDAVIEVYNGTSWITVANSHNHPEAGTYPKYIEMDLSPYINSNFQIRLGLVGGNGCGDYGIIDEVRVMAAP